MPKHDETTIFSTLLVDLAANEKGKVWPFSTYSVTTEMKGGFSKTFDISPEELRLNFYLNKDNTQVHLESMKKLNERVVQNRNYLRNSSNKSAIYEEYSRNGIENPSAQVDLSFLHQKGVVFESSSNSNQSSAFGSSAVSVKPASNPFGSPASNPFGSSNTVTASSTLKNSPAASSTTNPFQSASSNPFGSSQAVTGSQASSASDSTPANPFGTGSGTTKTSSQTSVFGSAIAVDESKLSKKQADDVVYSKTDKLSAAEIEAYKSAAFTLDNLPINAPAKEFCF